MGFRISLLYVLLLCLSLPVWAQQSEMDRIKTLEADRISAQKFSMDRKLDSAVMLMERGDYELTDQKLKAILRSTKSVGSDLTFYFGKNSFFLGNFKQSIDWLNKYIQLKGTTGQFSKEADDLLHKSEAALLKEKQVQSQPASTVFSSDFDIDCGPTGKVSCPVCGGSTVVIKRGYLGETYSTCPYCAKKGYLTCEDYNKLIRGQLKASAK